MNDEQYLLASAYLDGELTAAERAAAAADPDVMRVVSELTALQQAVDDAEAPTPAARSRAIEAALAEFDRVHDARPVVVPRASEPPGPVFEWARYLSIAAAVLVIGVLGVVIARGLGGGTGGDDDSAAEPAAASAVDTLAAADMTQAAGDSAAATVARSAGEGEAGAAAEQAESTAAADTDAILAAPAASGGEPIVPVDDLGTVITSPGQLTGLGLHLLDLSAAGALPPTPEGSCTYADAVANPAPGATVPPPERLAADPGTVAVLTEGRYAFGSDVREVLVAVDQATGQAFAVDSVACTLLVVGAVP